uniref:Uncharacterized protein n=1 Tax=Anguilla anguilla TaxID=7936 RepID=A0A0E9UP09_ANGAN
MGLILINETLIMTLQKDNETDSDETSG